MRSITGPLLLGVEELSHLHNVGFAHRITVWSLCLSE